MLYAIFAAAGLIAGIVIMFIIIAVIQAANNRRRKARGKSAEPPKKKRRIEFVKVIVFLVLLTYFIGVFIGAKIVFVDFSQLSVLLAFIGTPTTFTIGFYCWKAKAENIIKIKKENPEETAGISVDLNNIHT